MEPSSAAAARNMESFFFNTDITSAGVALSGSLALGFIGWFLLWQRIRKTKTLFSRHLPLPPGSFGLPWLGETLDFIRALQSGDISSFVRSRTARFRSKTFKTNVYFHATAVLQGAAANRFIATSENKQLLHNSWASSAIAIVGQHAPVAKHGAEHRRLRQIMASCLSSHGLQKLVRKTDLITEKHFVTCWEGQQQLSLCPLLKLHTFRIACSLLASIEDDALVANLYPLLNTWVAGLVALPLEFPGTTYQKARAARNMLVRELGYIIHRRQQEMGNDSAIERDPDMTYSEDLLSMLLRAQDENGDHLNRDELQDVLLFMLFAGHDTTTATIAFALKFLEQNPACYECLLQEHEAIASRKKAGANLNWADLQDMKYTWRVIQETMRVRPPVFGGSKIAKQDLSFDSYRIPKGWKVFYSTTTTHHDEKYFPEPMKFDPSRFDPEKKQEHGGAPPYAFVPFGLGPHYCPGNEFARMTISVYLHHLVRNFKWVSLEPNEEVCIFPMPTLSKGYPASISRLATNTQPKHGEKI